MVSLIVVGSIFVAVALGYKLKLNVGLIAIAFSYLFGTFMLGMKAKDIIGLWPTSLFFFIMMASFFYGIAVTNGTLSLISEHAIYAFRKKPWFIPIMMWLACFGISGLGPGPTTIFAFMPAIVLSTAEMIHMNKLVAAIIIVGGGVAGGYTPISLGYATVRACLTISGYSEAQIAEILPKVAFNNILAQVLIFILIYVICRSWKVTAPEGLKKPAPFSDQQKKTLLLIGTGLLIMVLFPLFARLMPSVSWIVFINKALNPSLFFTVLLVIGLIFKLGDQKKALNFVPFNMIILICGTGMLVSVAKKAGAIDLLVASLGNNLSPFVAKLMVALVAGCMSLFSSTLGVVAPALIPIISGLSASTGVSVATFVSAIMIGGHFAGVSPFSTGGAMTLAGETNEEKANKLMVQLIILAAGSIVFASILTIVGII